MAKMVKKHSSKQGLFSKLVNVAIIALGFSRPIFLFMTKPPINALDTIVNEASFGLASLSGTESKFDMKKGLRMYAPGGAAIGLGKLKQYLTKHFPVR